MEQASDRHETCGENPRPIPAFYHWLECSNFECRSRGPRARTPEAASLAFIAPPPWRLGGKKLPSE